MPSVGTRKLKAWFGPKYLGYGWYPITWEGWAIVIGFAVWIGSLVAAFATQPHTNLATLWFTASIALAVIFLCILCDSRCDEVACWRWDWEGVKNRWSGKKR